jgi:hypothetical protein
MRRSVENVHNSLANLWAQTLLSCIARLKPFQVQVLHDSNSLTWYTNMQAKLGQITFTMPPEEGYSSGATLAFKGGFTDYTFGGASIEDLVSGSFTITPSGAPTVTPGTYP